MNGWNTTQGSNGETVPYFFVIDQDSPHAHIIVRRETPRGSPYASISSDSAPPYQMRPHAGHEQFQLVFHGAVWDYRA